MRRPYAIRELDMWEEQRRARSRPFAPRLLGRRSAAGRARTQMPSIDTSEVSAAVRRNGYSFVPGSWFGPDLVASDEWASLAAAFDRLPVDRYLRNGATFRERRYG